METRADESQALRVSITFVCAILYLKYSSTSAWVVCSQYEASPQANQLLNVTMLSTFSFDILSKELAVHTKTSKAGGSIQIVPTWMPLWTLASFGVLSTAGRLALNGPWNPRFARQMLGGLGVLACFVHTSASSAIKVKQET